MKYIQAYDELYDESFQFEISDELAEELTILGAHISDTPWPKLPIMSRYRSERHPEWGGEQKLTGA